MTASRPKYPHVSYYPVTGKSRTGEPVERWRISYHLPGRNKRTERLGVNMAKAQKRARQISDLIDSIKSKLITVEEVERQLEDARGIGQHVVAYESHLKGKQASPEYLTTTIKRVKTSIQILNASRIAHLSPSAASKLVSKLQKTRKPRGDGSPGGPDAPFLSPQTVQHYLRALKQFTRWCKKSGRVVVDPLADVDGVQVTRTANRRDINLQEIVILLRYCKTAPSTKKWNEMKGEDRRMLYMFAFVTGLRRGELRPAQVSWIDFEGGCIRVSGEHTKNSNTAKQPLPAWMLAEAKAWIGDRTGELFPRMPQSLHRLFQKDVAAARAVWIAENGISDKERTAREESDVLKYETPAAGLLVFHSLRHGYVSMLANSDTPAKVVQSMARHADIKTTMNVYAHAASGAAQAAIEKVMPDLRGNQ